MRILLWIIVGIALLTASALIFLSYTQQGSTSQEESDTYAQAVVSGYGLGAQAGMKILDADVGADPRNGISYGEKKMSSDLIE